MMIPNRHKRMGAHRPILLLRPGSSNASTDSLLCFSPNMVTMSGFLRGENPLHFSLPLFLLQLLVIVVTTRATALLLRPLRLPRYISEIMGGFVLGPSVLGRIPNFAAALFPMRSLLVLESFAYLGLIFYIFTIGVEIELSIVYRAGRLRRSFGFAAACALPPFALGLLAGTALHRRLSEGSDAAAFLTLFSVALTVTAFSVLTRILAELKLAGSEVGRLALSAAVLTDGFAWAALVPAVALAQSEGDLEASLWAVASGAALWAGSFAVVRPAVERLGRRAEKEAGAGEGEGEGVGELEECAVLVGVMAAAFVADAVGTHVVFGAFVFGLAVPNGPFGVAIVEKVEDFVAGMLMPIFFAISGLRTDVFAVKDAGAAVFMVLVVLAAAAAKVVGSIFAAGMYDVPLHDGVSVGLLMNTKGIIELVILNIGRNEMILGDQSFTILVLMSVLVTALVSPLMTSVVKPVRRLVSYKRRTIRWPNPESELRILACVHFPRDVPSLISLVDIAHPTKRSPISVSALHLIELAGRASAFLLVNAGNPSHHSSRLQAQSEHVAHAFESYEQHTGGVSVHNLIAVSPYATMHEDAVAVAEDRHAALVLLPFHMHRSVDGGMEVSHLAIRDFNNSVMSSAPSTVGILIDRGLGGRRGLSGHRIAVLFFGGNDDREALALAGRMVGHPAIALMVIRFVEKAPMAAAGTAEEIRECRADEECIREFLARVVDGEAEYEERAVGDAEDVMASIREAEGDVELFVVGKGQGAVGSQLTAGMAEWSEFPELGPIGDLLASTDSTALASVLVVQAARAGEGPALMSPERREEAVRLYMDEGDCLPKVERR